MQEEVQGVQVNPLNPVSVSPRRVLRVAVGPPQAAAVVVVLASIGVVDARRDSPLVAVLDHDRPARPERATFD